MGHLVLLGDSVFDNGAYVEAGAPGVAQQLRTRLPPSESVTLLAVDGARLADVPAQIRDLPASATHLFLSAGGNDALTYLDAIRARRSASVSFGAALQWLAAFRDDFAGRYAPVVEALVETGRPVALCTVYSGRFEADLQRLVGAALPAIKEGIRGAALRKGPPLIGLGRALGEPDRDYATPIEPSAHGGRKIARALQAAYGTHDFEARETTVYAGTRT